MPGFLLPGIRQINHSGEYASIRVRPNWSSSIPPILFVPMNPRLLLPLTLCAGLALTGCDKSSPAASTAAPANSNTAAAEPPALPEVPAGPSETELKLEKQVHELEMRELDLRQQVEEQKLAATEKEIEKERALLEKER